MLLSLGYLPVFFADLRLIVFYYCAKYQYNQMSCKLVTAWERRIALSESLNVESRSIVFSKRKNLQNKSLDLTQFKFSGRLFVNETTCHENYQWWAWECRQLKSARKIHSTWSYNSTLHMKLVGNGLIHNIFQSTSI